jgi:hypothetical protein
MDDFILASHPSRDPGTARRTRDALTRRGLPHAGLTDAEATTLLLVLHGFSYTPTAADERRIIATSWLISALRSDGRYRAQHLIDRPAYLDDAGDPVDCIALMAVIQRHLLTERRPGWDSKTLSDQLSAPLRDLDRTQRALDTVAVALKQPARLGDHWWDSRSELTMPKFYCSPPPWPMSPDRGSRHSEVPR